MNVFDEPMESKSWMTPRATLLLFLITWREIVSCGGLTVNPPEDLLISDPGHLGRLEITWSAPTSLANTTQCPKMYQLEYFDTYGGSWSPVRTVRRTYTAQFDLMKDIQVRVYTLLSGPCTNNSMVKSTKYTELVQKPPGTGVVGTAVQNFVCVYYNMESMECNWERSPKTPAKSLQTLYFWHKGLEQAEECPKYHLSNGVRSGCDFTGISLPDFTDINFCVNGSSPDGPLQPAFISLQIQNQVKPKVVETLNLTTCPDQQLEIHWDRPVGRVPEHCLQWEVERSQEGAGGESESEHISATERSMTLPSSPDNNRHCFRVRSKVHKYCADKGFWSEWSPSTCHPEKSKAMPGQEWDPVAVHVCIAVAVIAAVLLLLCAGAMLAVRGSGPVKKLDSVLTALFAKSHVLGAEKS